MKLLKEKKDLIIVALITGIICITGTAYATSQISARNITYNNTTVDSALTNLYNSVDVDIMSNKFTLYSDISDNPTSNFTRRATITKTFTAEADTIYYLFGVYSWGVTTPGVNSKILSMGNEYGTITSFSEGVTLLDSPTFPFIKIRTGEAGTVTVNIKASTANSSVGDRLILKVYKYVD